MSKPLADDDDFVDLPPPYTPNPATNANTNTNPTPRNTNPNIHAFPPPAPAPGPHTALAASSLTHHLSTLGARLASAQAARATEQAARDLAMINLVVPHVEAFLSELAWDDTARGGVGELVLVPAGAVARGWALTGAAERRRGGEFLRVARVGEPRVGKSEKSVSGGDSGVVPEPVRSGRFGGEGYDDDDGDGDGRQPADKAGFDDWGRFDDGEGSSSLVDTPTASWWWFRDARLARRLAAYLQPRPEVNVERRHVQAAVVAAKADKLPSPSSGGGWRWSGLLRQKNKKDAALTSPPLSGTPGLADVRTPQDDGIGMTVRAEEMRFRRENDFGVWESLSGYAIAVTVKTRAP
ncbi:hypothetical protein B0T26DRAFT_752772 [Lasiosphaeria miniovina]|uniref:Uncharacterized protein n=1 Tax=Lasiosphaeria miniovina TaxID=1954250 RepID=A0AA40AB08_9PEZI|nr:uncharacterized protein B0T26DRAFT_752772 [Lasiosphaeria miniovina]KAK0712547.1 hypothetical protein B0T26DRAFT_752772 [Lasiosphaeria miniovina]